MDNYRLYGETVRTPFVRNQYANLSVVEEWNSIWSGVRSFHSNDTMVLYKRAGLGVSCKSGTFSLIIYYIPIYHILVTGHPYHIRTPR